MTPKKRRGAVAHLETGGLEHERRHHERRQRAPQPAVEPVPVAARVEHRDADRLTAEVVRRPELVQHHERGRDDGGRGERADHRRRDQHGHEERGHRVLGDVGAVVVQPIVRRREVRVVDRPHQRGADGDHPLRRRPGGRRSEHQVHHDRTQPHHDGVDRRRDEVPRRRARGRRARRSRRDEHIAGHRPVHVPDGPFRLLPTSDPEHGSAERSRNDRGPG